MYERKRSPYEERLSYPSDYLFLCGHLFKAHQLIKGGLFINMNNEPSLAYSF